MSDEANERRSARRSAPTEAVPAAEATAAAAPVKTAEAWARDKGMLPEVIVTPATKRAAATRRHNPEYSKYAAAFGAKPEGLEMTEAEFDQAVTDAAGHVYR